MTSTEAVTRPANAVVLGAGLAGLLAAHVLSRHVDTVTVVDRDVLPDGPEHRRGVPQAHHAHLLWSGGARLIDRLLPGTIDRLLGAGAHRIGFQEDLVTLTALGWQHRFPATQYAVLCGRPLLDWVVRDQVLTRADRITVRQRTEIVRLTGDARRVTGVVVRDPGQGAEVTLEADLVVDATGRGSRLGQWLSTLDVPALEKDIVDAGIAYATRLFQAPPGATTGFPAVNVAADHRVRLPGRFGVLYPVEDGRWIVTLSCTRGIEPPPGEAEFTAFAQALRDPIIADLVAGAEPLTPVFRSRSGANRRVYPERLDTWPEGLLVVGDSLTAFNPIYGHGMSTAARCATALDERLRRDEDGGPGATRRVQAAISAVVDDPWILAASKDIGYVGCRSHASDPRLADGGTGQRLQFADFITARSLRDPDVCTVVTDVISLNKAQSELGSSGFLRLLQQDGARPELREPPLTRAERDLVGLPEGSAAGSKMS